MIQSTIWLELSYSMIQDGLIFRKDTGELFEVGESVIVVQSTAEGDPAGGIQYDIIKDNGVGVKIVGSDDPSYIGWCGFVGCRNTRVAGLWKIESMKKRGEFMIELELTEMKR